MTPRLLPEMDDVVINVVDSYQFRWECSLDDAVLLGRAEERVKEQARIWWAEEANRGVGWYLKLESATLKEALDDVGTTPWVTPWGRSNSGGAEATLLKKLVRNGVPPQLRPKVWLSISGAAKKVRCAPDGYYQELLREVEGRDTKSTRQIENDLHRTFPGHPKLDTADGLAALRRILVAYSWRDSRVGYCQGMNFVAAHLLLVMRNEEEAFWMLATLIEDVLYDDCFSEDLAGTHVEQRVLKDLLLKRLPKVCAHFETIGFDVTLVTTEWFLCLFTRTFPTETSLRVWDILFSEGAKILFRVAVAIFKVCEDSLLKAQHIGDTIQVLQGATYKMFDPDVLFKVAFEKLGQMSMTSISKQRQMQQPAVQAELEERLRHKLQMQMRRELEKERLEELEMAGGEFEKQRQEGRRQMEEDERSSRERERNWSGNASMKYVFDGTVPRATSNP
eukprot:TRINITY_DN21072_c0_g1_i1.p1 TRINITY_DN21072_c0_g1~~TRINITY_DN21072_c0_g1_i1.p1  ORF type:complete len:449 (-),score=102.27 TRINITY_DN21072_c0_g1_i1:1650-2996(-)